jgi:hypothetical protein
MQKADKVSWLRRVARELCRYSVFAALIAMVFLASSTLLFAQHSNSGAASMSVTVSPADQLTTTGGTTADLKIRLGTGPAYLWGDSLSDCSSAPTIGSPTTISASGTYTPALSVIPFNTTSNDYVCVYDPGTPSLNTSVAWPHAGLNLAFTQQPTSAASGVSISPAVKVQVNDSNNIRVASSTASVTLGITGGPGTLSGATTQTAVNGIATFSGLSVNKDGSYTLTATSSGISSGTSNAFNITSSSVSASTSTVSANPTTVTADGSTTSTITVTLLDTNSNPVSGKAVSLTAGSGSSTITTVSGTTNASGQATFTVKDAVAQSVIYTAKDTTDSVTITPTATVTFTASKLAFTNSALSVTAGVCSSQVTVQTQDGSNNPTDPPSLVTIALSSSSTGTYGFYSNSGCTTQITSLTIATSANSAGFYYKDTKAASPVITAAATGGITSSATQTETVSAATASKLVWGQEPLSTVTNTAVTPAMTVYVEDQFGNLTTTGASSITMSVSFNFSPTSKDAIAGTVIVTPANGVATFSNVYITGNKNGSSATSYFIATMGSFTVDSSLFQVTGL